MTANRTYLANIKPKLLSQNSKLKLCTTLTLTYGSEIWTKTAEEINLLGMFESKTVRKMCGRIKEEEEDWRIRTNKEIKNTL